jgi:voltage-gated potassium channel
MHQPAPSPFHASARTLSGLDRRERRRALTGTVVRSVGAVTIIITAYYLAPLNPEPWGRVVFRIVAMAVLLGVVLWHQLRSITRSLHPGLRAIEALSLTVPLLIVLFSSTYVVMSRWNAAAFNEALNRTTALYFTMVTLATIGYGDIHAESDGARIVVMFQIVFNVAIIGVAVRLISSTAQTYAQARSEELPEAEAEADRPAEGQAEPEA